MKLSTGVLFTEKQIQQRILEIARQIEADYEGKSIVLCGVLKGCIPFLSDLMRKIPGNVQIALIEMKSKVDGKHADIVFTTQMDLADRDVIVVEDIVDTGITIDYLIKHLEMEKGTRSIRVAALLDKPEARKVDVPVHYRGFAVPNKFIVGYGLDYKEQYRNLPYLSWVEP